MTTQRSIERSARTRLRKTRHRTSQAGALLPGEKLIGFYAHDCAGCSCEPTTALTGVPCIAVGRTAGRWGSPGRDRCLGCGESWPQMERRGVAA
jgi:hypothetical protein